KRWLHADERLRRGWILNGAAGLRAHPEHGEARVHSSRRTAAGAAGLTIIGVRVEGLACDGALGVSAIAGEIRHVGLAKDDRASFAESRDDVRILGRDHVD